MKTIVINADPKIKQEIGKLLKSASEGLQLQVEMMKKAWLHQIFDREL